MNERMYQHNKAASLNRGIDVLLVVHGDIRHLEMNLGFHHPKQWVHGDIRHLEIKGTKKESNNNVHGDIRHLEKLRRLMSIN